LCRAASGVPSAPQPAPQRKRLELAKPATD